MLCGIAQQQQATEAGKLATTTGGTELERKSQSDPPVRFLIITPWRFNTTCYMYMYM